MTAPGVARMVSTAALLTSSPRDCPSQRVLPASGRTCAACRQSGHHGAVAPRSSLEIGQNAAEIVAPEWNVIGPDVAGIGDSLMAALGGAVKNPADVMTASMRLSSDLARIPSTVLNSWIRKPKGDDKVRAIAGSPIPRGRTIRIFMRSGWPTWRNASSRGRLSGPRVLMPSRRRRRPLGSTCYSTQCRPRISRSRIQPR